MEPSTQELASSTRFLTAEAAGPARGPGKRDRALNHGWTLINPAKPAPLLLLDLPRAHPSASAFSDRAQRLRREESVFIRFHPWFELSGHGLAVPGFEERVAQRCGWLDGVLGCNCWAPEPWLVLPLVPVPVVDSCVSAVPPKAGVLLMIDEIVD